MSSTPFPQRSCLRAPGLRATASAAKAPRSSHPQPALVAFLLATFAFSSGAVAQEPAPSARESESAERAQLFIALLKRRAERILESRRAPPPPLWSFFAGSAYGYESNVNLDGFRKGDNFVEESGSLSFRPQLARGLSGELSYDFSGTQFHEMTDSNLWAHTWKGMLQWQPRPAWQLDLGGEYGILNFPLDSDNSFFDKRAKAALSYAQAPWLTHRVGWTYQFREYDTRLARDANQAKTEGYNREDRRHTALYEARLRFPKTFLRLGAEWYENLSNDHYQDFYDWQDIRFRGLLTRILSSRWTGTLSASHERKNYASRSVPAISVAERDNLLTLAGSLIYQLHKNVTASYSLTYRYQDSNDPRLDFTDWVHQVGVTFSF